MLNKINETQAVYDINNNIINYIDPAIINRNKMSINLFGSDTSELSTSLNENFIRIIQSFYGSEPPLNPVIGQTWFNENDKLTYRWLGKNWVQLEKDIIFDSFMYVIYNLQNKTEFVLNESVFNFTIENIKIYDQNMRDVKFILDSFDSKKIILKDTDITTLYILVFHPKDRITNPIKNKKLEIFTESGQTQYDLGSFLDNSDINTLSVSLNDILLKNNEFSIINNILTLDGMIYRIKKNDKLTIWKYGGSLTSYYSTFHIITNLKESFIKIPKFFKDIMILKIIDLDNNVIINPVEIEEFDDYIHFEFLDKKNIKIISTLRII